MEQKVTCPKCGTTFPLTEAITQEVETRIRDKFDKELAKKDEAFKLSISEMEAKAKANYEKQLAEETANVRKEAKQAAKAELDESLKEKDIMLKELKDKVKETRKTVKEEMAEDLKEKDKELKELQGKITEFRKNELDVKKKERELEDREHKLKLQLQEDLKKETQKIWKEANDKLKDDYGLKMEEKDKTISDLGKKINELQRKADQGSVQLQGEVQEYVLEKLLAENFPLDDIRPVSTGKRGADIVQLVRSDSGRPSGTILWESKRTKNWSESWIGKLKDDQREQNADIAVIASEALPCGVDKFTCYESIWITDLQHAVALAGALRINLIQVHQARASIEGMTEKRDLVYKYLTGVEFKQRVEVMVEAFNSMRKDLITEQNAMQKAWAKREKQITTVVFNIAGMVGDIQGLGAHLQPVKNLELPGGK